MSEIEKLECQIGAVTRVARCHRKLAMRFPTGSREQTHHLEMAANLLGDECEELMVEIDRLKAKAAA